MNFLYMYSENQPIFYVIYSVFDWLFYENEYKYVLESFIIVRPEYSDAVYLFNHIISLHPKFIIQILEKNI